MDASGPHPSRLELCDRRQQLLFCLVHPAGHEIDPAATCPAEGGQALGARGRAVCREGCIVVRRQVIVHRGSPLGDATTVTEEVRCLHQGTTSVAELPGVTSLSRGRCRHGFVQMTDARLDIPRADLQDPQAGQRGQLEVGIGGFASDGCGLRRESYGIGPGPQRLRTLQGYPSTDARVREIGCASDGTSQPALCHRTVPVQHPVLAREPDRHPGGLFLPALPPVTGVRPGPDLERFRGAPQPPQRLSQAIQSGRGHALFQGGFEGLFGVRPASFTQGPRAIPPCILVHPAIIRPNPRALQDPSAGATLSFGLAARWLPTRGRSERSNT